MLESVLRYLRNWFIADVHEGSFEVVDSGISLPFLREGQYFRVCGSVFNDGLYQYPASGLVDEVFDGVIWALAIPAAVVALSDEVEGWQEQNAAVVMSPYKEESFGGYQYTRATTEGGQPITWQVAFADRLAPYRKPRECGYMR